MNIHTGQQDSKSRSFILGSSIYTNWNIAIGRREARIVSSGVCFCGCGVLKCEIAAAESAAFRGFPGVPPRLPLPALRNARADTRSAPYWKYALITISAYYPTSRSLDRLE
jgi:hypothetical protein